MSVPALPGSPRRVATLQRHDREHGLRRHRVADAVFGVRVESA
jgi:hypothetical protein